MVSAPSLLAPTVPRWVSPPSERSESAGGGKSRSGLSSEERGPAGGSGTVDERGTGRGSILQGEESPGERSGRAGGIGPGVIPGAEAGVGESGGVGVAAGRHGSGVGAGLAPGRGERSGWGGTAWFHLLRQRIERAKRYPAQARRWGMEGTAEVQFRIAGDGSVQGVMVVKSSGFAILDRASVETIKRAAPFPVISGAIRIPISYRLRDTQ
ncbi:MAG: energy transducer TonB [candidate division NC10 bacterium]